MDGRRQIDRETEEEGTAESTLLQEYGFVYV